MNDRAPCRPMKKQPVILDYAPVEFRRWRSAQLFLKCLRLTHWFLFQRPLDAAEVAVAGHLVWVALYIFWAARHFELGSDSLKPALSLTLLLPCVVALALLRLARRHRWGAILVFVLVAVVAAPLAGMIQIERCPHAAYVQVLGFSVSVEGERCGNNRKIEPWWMRE